MDLDGGMLRGVDCRVDLGLGGDVLSGAGWGVSPGLVGVIVWGLNLIPLGQVEWNHI